jgi:hypothetical protein
MEEPNLLRKVPVTVRSIVICSVWILICSVAALPFRANQGTAETKTDYALVREDIGKFELAINDVINSTFATNSFAVVQRAKGAYLPGYGISLSFLINIHRAVVNTPFGQVRSRADISPESKKRRIDELKEKLIRALQDSGESFRQLPKEDYVTIIAFFEDRNFPDEPNENKTIVMSVFKKDLDEFARRSDRLKEFKQRMKIVEY